LKAKLDQEASRSLRLSDSVGDLGHWEGMRNVEAKHADWLREGFFNKDRVAQLFDAVKKDPLVEPNREPRGSVSQAKTLRNEVDKQWNACKDPASSRSYYLWNTLNAFAQRLREYNGRLAAVEAFAGDISLPDSLRNELKNEQEDVMKFLQDCPTPHTTPDVRAALKARFVGEGSGFKGKGLLSWDPEAARAFLGSVELLVTSGKIDRGAYDQLRELRRAVKTQFDKAWVCRDDPLPA